MDTQSTVPATSAFWLVLTPSVDSQRWIASIDVAARTAGWRIVSEYEASGVEPGPQRLVITSDADTAKAYGAARVAAIVAVPESAPDTVAEVHGMLSAEAIWHASTLLARALALAPDHRVVTAAELSAKPSEIVLFDTLSVAPPDSLAEFARDPLLAAAFRIYRDVASDQDDVFEWSERLFNYCPKASSDLATSGVLDTTGRPRMLVHGPYLSLPPGLWRATMRFGVDKDAAKHQYRLDWGTRTATISEHVVPGAPGIYELTLDFDWVEADAAEIRIILLEGSFTGALMFEAVKVSRIARSSEAVRTAA